MAKASTKAKKSQVPAAPRAKATRSAIPAAVFSFDGERQPQEFADGVASAMAILRELEKCGDVATEDLLGVPARVTARIRQAADRGGKFTEGAIVALCSYSLSCMTGSPELEHWVPLSSQWRGENADVLPPDCLFFDVDGKLYSVEVNLNTTEWEDGRFWGATVGSIRGRAKPITRAQFEKRRAKQSSARKREVDKQRAAAEAAEQQRKSAAAAQSHRSDLRLAAKIEDRVAKQVREQIIDAIRAEQRDGKGAGLALIDARYAAAKVRLESMQSDAAAAN